MHTKKQPPSNCTSIKEYERSTYWKSKSAELLKDTSLICPICGRSRFLWQKRNKKWKRVRTFCVHHKTYKNVPNEKDEDLIILCSTCHTLCHKILQLQNVGKMYKELADIVKKYFFYEKGLSENPYFQKDTKNDR